MITEIQFVSRLSLALLLGAFIGLERQWRQRTAGLRTNSLVATGSALFVMLASVTTPDTTGMARIAAQVVSGIGFLGAGVILREGLSVRGLNTAATLWCAAAVGTLAGAGWKLAAVTGTLAVLAIHLCLRPLALRINRQPIDTSDLITQYRVLLVCGQNDEARIRASLLQTVTPTSLILRSLLSEDQENSARVEVKAILISNGRDDAVLEQLVGRLSLEPGVSAVSWEILDQESGPAILIG
jgi:putative Mg2+ transporter-C (MgtC) family protein